MSKPTSKDLPGLLYAQALLRDGPPLRDNGAFNERLSLAVAQAEAAHEREHRSTAPIDYPEDLRVIEAGADSSDQVGADDQLPGWRGGLNKIIRSEFVSGLLKAHGHLPVPFRVGILMLQAALVYTVTYSVVASLFN